MNDITSLVRRVERAERRARWSMAVAGLAACAIVIGAMRPASDVLRARGLVIVDAHGKPRIVLGAPITGSVPDAKLAGATGMVVLDSGGRLGVAVGSNNPLVFANGQLGKRLGTGTGLTIYDPRNGGERGGMVAFADGHANLCLDYEAKGKEAVCMTVAPNDQYAATLVNGNPSVEAYDQAAMFVGADGSGVIKIFGGGANQSGVMLVGGKGPRPIKLYDSTQAEIVEAKP